MSEGSMAGLEPTDAGRARLRSKPVAVIGYGSQGHAHALNLSDSGVDVVVGLREGSSSEPVARDAGLRVTTPARAAVEAGLVSMLVPDTAQPKLWHEELLGGIEAGDAVLFAHGFNVHFGQIDPPEMADTILVAPKSPGAMLRREFSAGRGVPALFAVHRDATGTARDLSLAYAEAIGSTRAGVIETTFAEETETDLFGEQAVLCGGLSALVHAGFETLVEAGYQPEVAYFECLHEMKLIVDLMYAGGVAGMRAGVSDTAEYGDYVAGSRIINESSRAAMREILEEVRSGEFARKWMEEAHCGVGEFEGMRAASRAHPIESVGAELRQRMTWLGDSA